VSPGYGSESAGVSGTMNRTGLPRTAAPLYVTLASTMTVSFTRVPSLGTTRTAFVATPLVSGDTANGVFLIAFADNRPVSDDERAYLSTLGRIGGQAMARTSLESAR